jgi:hypothetical protein
VLQLDKEPELNPTHIVCLDANNSLKRFAKAGSSYQFNQASTATYISEDDVNKFELEARVEGQPTTRSRLPAASASQMSRPAASQVYIFYLFLAFFPFALFLSGVWANFLFIVRMPARITGRPTTGKIRRHRFLTCVVYVRHAADMAPFCFGVISLDLARSKIFATAIVDGSSWSWFFPLNLKRRKYALSLIDRLLQLLGPKIGVGYDIACTFSKTAKSHPLFQDRLQDVSWACGIFHAYAHNRLCQLSFNPRLIEGFGLDDLEGCERLFHLSNALAPTTRHSSMRLRFDRIEDKFQLINSDRIEAIGTFPKSAHITKTDRVWPLIL